MKLEIGKYTRYIHITDSNVYRAVNEKIALKLKLNKILNYQR